MSEEDLAHKFAMIEGHRIAYLDIGEGPPLVLLHGIPTSSLLWRKVIPALAKTCRVNAPDMSTLVARTPPPVLASNCPPDSLPRFADRRELPEAIAAAFPDATVQT